LTIFFDDVCEKMQKKIVISMAVVTLLLVGIITTSVLASNPAFSNNAAVSNQLQAANKEEISKEPVSVKEYTFASVNADDSSIPSISVENGEAEVDVDNIRDEVPNTFEETEEKISIRRTRFLLYTNDGKYIMWGYVGNNHFVGTDNLGNRCWGIYGKGVFAGFYDGEFFWGKYRSGSWKAEGLFGLNAAQGKYILFPTSDITPTVSAAEK
jgi:hypothetical protein